MHTKIKTPSFLGVLILVCIYITKSEPILKVCDTSVPRALKRYHAKCGASDRNQKCERTVLSSSL